MYGLWSSNGRVVDGRIRVLLNLPVARRNPFLFHLLFPLIDFHLITAPDAIEQNAVHECRAILPLGTNIKLTVADYYNFDLRTFRESNDETHESFCESTT